MGRYDGRAGADGLPGPLPCIAFGPVGGLTPIGGRTGAGAPGRYVGELDEPGGRIGPGWGGLFDDDDEEDGPVGGGRGKALLGGLTLPAAGPLGGGRPA